jgi:predicted HTH domain antitoxin
VKVRSFFFELPPDSPYICKVLIDLGHEAIRELGLSEAEALLDLAVGLFTESRLTLGKAASLAKITQSDFQRELGRRGISMHYDVEDFRADMRTLANLKK